MVVFALLLGFAVGYGAGVKATIDYVAKVGFKLLELKKIDVDVDQQMIANGLIQYKNNIGGCLFLTK
jgi:hypothetical protein